MTVSRRTLLAGAALLASTRPSHSVIVLDSTWKAERGFRAHMALASQPQFASVIALSNDDGKIWGQASGTWLGNVDGNAVILTAAHVFDRGGSADDYVYRAPDGEAMQGTDIVFHPLYTWSNALRTGYDFAIVTLDGPIEDAGPPPALYGGAAENGKRITMVGFGSRGIGSVGQKPEYYTAFGKAAAENTVDEVMNAVRPPPPDADAGNWLGVTLRREGQGAERLDGILGSGDSGGSAWMRTANGWAIVGVAANGNGDTYGSQSWFARISGVRDWLSSRVPGLRFVN
ncbi:MAG: serine protease [Reyranella sp.]|nr:MAG: serine protease [Reyranella sp.]